MEWAVIIKVMLPFWYVKNDIKKQYHVDSSTDDSTTMVWLIVDSPTASLPNDCSPYHC